MATIIERADNRATRVFGIGFGFAMVMLLPIMGVLIGLGLGVVVDLAFGPGHTSWVFAIFLMLMLVPWVIARLTDRVLGERLKPDQGLGRGLAAILDLYSRIGLGRGSNPLVGLFVSHEGRRRAGWIAALLIAPVMLVLFLQISIGRGHLPLGFFVGIAADDTGASSSSPSAFYTDSGGSEMAEVPLPHIPGRVAHGPYVELFIPFLPRYHGLAMQATCPQALSIQTEPQATQARLQCLAGIVDVRVDGQALGIPLLASTDAASKQPGMLAMLPIASLPAGQHEISLSRPSRAGRSPTRYRIAFWK